MSTIAPGLHRPPDPARSLSNVRGAPLVSLAVSAGAPALSVLRFLLASVVGPELVYGVLAAESVNGSIEDARESDREIVL